MKCKFEFDPPAELGPRSGELTCPHCQAKIKVKWKMEMELAPDEESVHPQAAAGTEGAERKLKILVAVDGEATQDVMKEVLSEAGHEVFLASTGKEALSYLEKEHPEVAYLDVALPQVLGFEVCEIIKRSPRLKATKVILVSAIYDKTRYKRSPTSLYGADDYIERHHIQDGLLLKLNTLIRSAGQTSSGSATHSENGKAPTAAPPVSLEDFKRVIEGGPLKPEGIPDRKETPGSPEPPSPDQKTPETPAAKAASDSGELPETRHEPAAQIALPEQSVPVATRPPEEEAKHEEARRFARLIVSDIALYNQKTIEEGIENGNVEDLLKDDMAEAEKLYRERVSAEIRESTRYLGDALRELIDRKTKLMKQKS